MSLPIEPLIFNVITLSHVAVIQRLMSSTPLTATRPFTRHLQPSKSYNLIPLPRNIRRQLPPFTHCDTYDQETLASGQTPRRTVGYPEITMCDV
ncbi:hypothetical protein Aduo_006099 [Ancylostoma duodenale]